MADHWVRGGNPEVYQSPSLYDFLGYPPGYPPHQPMAFPHRIPGNRLPPSASAFAQQGVNFPAAYGSVSYDPGAFAEDHGPQQSLPHSPIVPPSFTNVHAFNSAHHTASTPSYGHSINSTPIIPPIGPGHYHNGQAIYRPPVSQSWMPRNRSMPVPRTRARRAKRQAFSIFWNRRKDFEAVEANIDITLPDTFVNPTTAKMMGCDDDDMIRFPEPRSVGHFQAVGTCDLRIRAWARNMEERTIRAYVLVQDSPDFDHIRLGADFIGKSPSTKPSMSGMAKEAVSVPQTPGSRFAAALGRQDTAAALFGSMQWTPSTTNTGVYHGQQSATLNSTLSPYLSPPTRDQSVGYPSVLSPTDSGANASALSDGDFNTTGWPSAWGSEAP